MSHVPTAISSSFGSGFFIAHSFCLLRATLLRYSMWTANASGITPDYVEVGCTMFMAVVVTINLKLAMKTR